jgi:DNA invertase Pin-like site-specific DNA recombinase
MRIGYIRISKQEQNEALQVDVLKEASCEKVFIDKMTGSKFERDGPDEALAYIRPGDTLVVWKLDRFGRSLQHLIEAMSILKERDVNFISLVVSSDDPFSGSTLRSSVLTLIICGCNDVQRRSSHIMTEKIDTTTPDGKLIFHLMGVLAEFERDLIRERTNAGFPKFTPRRPINRPLHTYPSRSITSQINWGRTPNEYDISTRSSRWWTLRP